MEDLVAGMESFRLTEDHQNSPTGSNWQNGRQSPQGSIEGSYFEDSLEEIQGMQEGLIFENTRQRDPANQEHSRANREPEEDILSNLKKQTQEMPTRDDQLSDTDEETVNMLSTEELTQIEKTLPTAKQAKFLQLKAELRNVNSQLKTLCIQGQTLLGLGKPTLLAACKSKVEELRAEATALEEKIKELKIAHYLEEENNFDLPPLQFGKISGFNMKNFSHIR